MADSVRTQLTLIVPTRNERENIAPLVERLPECVDRVVFVDDSDDGTQDEIQRLGVVDERLFVMHRMSADRNGGLAGAVTAGLDTVHHGVVGILDADLQHPPEVVGALFSRLMAPDQPEVDLVVACRAGDAARASMAPHRKFLSWFAGRVALFGFGRDISTADPMSGFFMFKRSTVDTTMLHADGFKILLEILVTHPQLRVEDVPYTFAKRVHGKSKGTVAEGMRFGRHVIGLRLRSVRFRRRGAR